MARISVTKPKYAPLFGGVGFHNSEAGMYRLLSRRSFEEKIAKCNRELSPGFMRCFAGYSDWTRQAMDDFADYYEQMQKVTDTPIYLTPGRGKLHFSEEDMRRYADDVAVRLEYLVRKRNVKHLAYYCFSNELSQLTNGALQNRLTTFQRYHELLYDAFQRRRLPLGLLATDAAMDWSSIDWAMEHMDPITCDYCGHWYERGDACDLSFYQRFYERCTEYAVKAARKEKHFLLGEFGVSKENTALQGTAIKDVCTYFDSGDYKGLSLMLAEAVAAAVNAGVFALMSWTFCDYPDPMVGPAYADERSASYTLCEPFLGGGVRIRYNKWGLLKWEEDGSFTPRPHYFAFGPIVRYLKRNSKILQTVSDDPFLRGCAVLTRRGRLSLLLVNRSREEKPLELQLPQASGLPLRVFLHRTDAPDWNPFADLPAFQAEVAPSSPRWIMPPESIAVLTDDYTPAPRHVEAEILGTDGQLVWKPVRDERHCYYRVFDGEEQIASTIAEHCTVSGGGSYRVVSVDWDGNQ